MRSWKGLYQSKNILNLFVGLLRRLGPTKTKELSSRLTVVDLDTRTQGSDLLVQCHSIMPHSLATCYTAALGTLGGQ